MKLAAAVLALFPFVPACAALNAPSTTSSEVITETSVRSHMEFLASDAMNGRR